jgi:small membrane protein
MEHFKLVKFILLFLIFGLIFVYFAKVRSQLLDRLVVLFIGGFGIALVILPDMASWLAHLVGVGRGADLLMYISLTGIMYLLILIYSRLNKLEAKITHLVRDIAIDRSAFLADDKTNYTPPAASAADSHLSDKG